jgi:hypothetical protein
VTAALAEPERDGVNLSLGGVQDDVVTFVVAALVASDQPAEHLPGDEGGGTQVFRWRGTLG